MRQPHRIHFGPFRAIPRTVFVYFPALMAMVLLACASAKNQEQREETELIDKLTLFVEAVQMEQWSEALNMTTPMEQRHLLNGESELSETTKTQLRSLKLSTVAHRGKVYLVKDKLEGIARVLPQALMTPVGEPTQEVPSFQ